MQNLFSKNIYLKWKHTSIEFSVCILVWWLCVFERLEWKLVISVLVAKHTI